MALTRKVYHRHSQRQPALLISLARLFNLFQLLLICLITILSLTVLRWFMSRRFFVGLSLWNKASWMTTTTIAAALSTTSAAATTCAMTVEHMPPIGLGTYLLQREQVADAIHSALAAGYRRIDCAPVYFNEDVIGDTLGEEMTKSNIQRSDLFIVSKLASPFHRQEHVERALRKTLSDLRLTYLDLYLIHWPVAFKNVDIPNNNQRGWKNEDIDDSDGGKNIDPHVSVKETWKAMENLLMAGLVRSIGVSNFPVALLHELMAEARIPPAVNQVEMHPYLQQPKLLAYCQARGIHVQAYSPLGTPGYKGEGEPDILKDETLRRIATNHNVTAAQICLAWALQRRTSVVSKSASPSRQAENLAATTIQIGESEIKEIALLNRGYRFFRPEEWWGYIGMAVFD